MKKYCKICNHRCHCVGQGFYVNGNKCDTCICDNCNCSETTSIKKVKKNFWQKIKDWLF